MEYRVRITVPGIPHEDDSLWEPFIEYLEQNHGQYGPVLSWWGGSPHWPHAVVTMATDAESESAAVSELKPLVRVALDATGLADRELTVVETELAD